MFREQISHFIICRLAYGNPFRVGIVHKNCRRKAQSGIRTASSPASEEAELPIQLDHSLLRRDQISVKAPLQSIRQPLRQPLAASQRCFAFEQKRKPFGVAEAGGLVAGFDVGEGLGHAVKAERVELIEGRMREQGVIS